MKNKHMRPDWTGRVLVAVGVLMVTGACLTGCSTPNPQTPEEKIQASAEDLRATLERAVEDVGKRRQMQALADQALADLQAATAELAGLRQEQERLNADYNATREAFQELDDRMQVLRRKYVAQFIDARQVLAGLATDDEWKEITGRDQALLNL